MKILVGLGNPGEKYKFNRHNVGFLVVDKIAEDFAVSAWKKGFKGLMCECHTKNEKFLLFKPETFMNNSGFAVMAITQFYKLTSDDIIVFQDDLDLKFGQIKIKRCGGHAGHNGIRSIHNFIGEEYTRVRIGIGHPKEKNKVSSYVLSNFCSPEAEELQQILEGCKDNISYLLINDITTFSAKINKTANI